MFNFSNEALQIILDYIKEFREALEKLQFELDPLYTQILSSEFEDIIKFRCIKYSRKRGAKKIGTHDAHYVLKKLGRPTGLLKKIKGSFSQRIVLKSLKFIREALQKSEKPVVLDAGCGWGRHLKRLQAQNIKGLEMVGVDLDYLSLYYGKTINKQAIFLKSDIKALPFRDQTFDLILCNAVIHEIETGQGREKLIREFAHVLKPQGTLYITDAFAKFRIISFIFKTLRHVSPKIEWHFPKNRLEKILLRSSFKVIYEEKFGSNLQEGTISYVIIAIKG
ncbi:MAG: class I SAM-dependent methyltransferase [Candidatus Bathyarchaeia archaeon]|nr:class I SAM-dependent methyltransferase [Candidatus Bathyarchaeia archaeon]